MQALNFHFRVRKPLFFKGKINLNILFPFNPYKVTNTSTSYTNNKNRIAIVLHLESIY